MVYDAQPHTLIISVREKNPEIVPGRFKEFTLKKLVQEIESNLEKSRT